MANDTVFHLRHVLDSLKRHPIMQSEENQTAMKHLLNASKHLGFSQIASIASSHKQAYGGFLTVGSSLKALITHIETKDPSFSRHAEMHRGIIDDALGAYRQDNLQYIERD